MGAPAKQTYFEAQEARAGRCQSLTRAAGGPAAPFKRCARRLGEHRPQRHRWKRRSLRTAASRHRSPRAPRPAAFGTADREHRSSAHLSIVSTGSCHLGPTMPDVPLLPALLLRALLLAPQLCAWAHTPQQQPPPWRCAPCSAEKLAQCPPVPASCPELARSAGCGCCPMCALQLGASCGVATARCAGGLTCRPRPGETRPLRALTRGQGVCMRESDALVSAKPTGKTVDHAWAACGKEQGCPAGEGLLRWPSNRV